LENLTVIGVHVSTGAGFSVMDVLAV